MMGYVTDVSTSFTSCKLSLQLCTHSVPSSVFKVFFFAQVTQHTPGTFSVSFGFISRIVW